MMKTKRRHFLKAAVTLGAASAFPFLSLAAKGGKGKQRVIIIGGGFAGATAAKYLRMWSPATEVVMIERQPQFVSCPQSNLVLSGSRTLQQLTFDYHGLEKYDVKRVQAQVTTVDTTQQKLTLDDGVRLDYTRLIIAPGVDFIYDSMPQIEHHPLAPHAWKAGAQTQLLQRQLVSMRAGGTMVMTIPGMPFRCPPGPYERACQIAFYLKQHNPGAKLVVLDENADIVSKKPLFSTAWQRDYADIIEYVPNSRLDDIDIKRRRIDTEFDSFRADVMNIIPPQKAGRVAELAGVVNVDKRWCGVDFLTYESTVQEKVHIIGDAVAASLPKSGHMANQQAKVCAAAVASLLAGQAVEQEPVFSNTCYSFVDNQRAGYIAQVFRYNKKFKEMRVMPNMGISQQGTRQNGQFANAWARNIWTDMLM